MASSPFSSTKETTNYARLCRLLIDVGSQVLRGAFDRIHPQNSLHTLLAKPDVHTKLKSLQKKRVINPTQWDKLYPARASSVSSAHFDVTLLIVLLRNICNLHPPATGWDDLPFAADKRSEADIARVKYYRNTVYAHASQASVDDATFARYWQEIRETLVRLGGAGTAYGEAIDRLAYDSMDPDVENHYQELLKEWKKNDDSIKDKLDEIEKMLTDLTRSEKRTRLTGKGYENHTVKETMITCLSNCLSLLEEIYPQIHVNKIHHPQYRHHKVSFINSTKHTQLYQI